MKMARGKLEQVQALLDDGKFIQARVLCKPICADRNTTSARAWLMLATIDKLRGATSESFNAIKQAIKLQPELGEAHLELGRLLAVQGKTDDAVASFKRAVEFDPDDSETHLGLATVLAQQGKHTEAASHFERVLDRNSTSVAAHYGLGACLAQTGSPVNALNHLREATRIAPDHLASWIGIVSLLLATGKQDKVLKACDQVLRLQPDNLDVLAMSAQILTRNGERMLATERLRPVLGLSRENVRIGLAVATLADNPDQYAHAIDSLEQLMATGKAQTADVRRRVLFSLGRLHDKTGDYGKAFDYYREGNDLVVNATTRATIDNRSSMGQARVAALTSIHSLEQHASLPHASNTSQLPLLIIGMPRSGTSLVEQILASHPEVHGAGELNWLPHLADGMQTRTGSPAPYPQCITTISGEELDEIAGDYLGRLEKLGGPASRVTDKMPGNYKLLGLVDLLIPAARVIHCVRDPLDTCLSIYFQEFQKGGTYSGDLTDVGRIYLQYRQLMEHWKKTISIPVMEVRYEDLVSDQEGISRKLIDFCGLEWNRQCLKFYESDRTIRTASFAQANKPIYRDSIERWRNYDAWLDPLRDILGIQDCD